MRGLIATFLCLTIVNKKIKHVVWDSVPCLYFVGLAVRSIQATVLVLIMFTIVKYLSLVYIGLAQNLTPLVTVIMSYFATGERLKLLDLFLIFITFVGVTCITIGIVY